WYKAKFRSTLSTAGGSGLWPGHTFGGMHIVNSSLQARQRQYANMITGESLPPYVTGHARIRAVRAATGVAIIRRMQILICRLSPNPGLHADVIHRISFAPYVTAAAGIWTVYRLRSLDKRSGQANGDLRLAVYNFVDRDQRSAFVPF